MKFEVEHKYCGYRKIIEGENIFDAFKRNGLDFVFWNIKSAEAA